MKLFRLVNVVIHNDTPVHAPPPPKGKDPLKFRLRLIQGLTGTQGSAVPCPVCGCPSTEPPPNRKNEHHSYSEFPSQKRWLSHRDVSCAQNRENEDNLSVQ
jgi:hypothetical protein